MVTRRLRSYLGSASRDSVGSSELCSKYRVLIRLYAGALGSHSSLLAPSFTTPLFITERGSGSGLDSAMHLLCELIVLDNRSERERDREIQNTYNPGGKSLFLLQALQENRAV